MMRDVQYVIVGGGLAGVSAIEEIRKRDKEGSILLISAEDALPYHRPPLTKELWFKSKSVDDIFIQSAAYYESEGIALRLGTRVVELDAGRKTIQDDTGAVFGFDKLLLATGGTPRKLDIAGGDDPGVCYYRTLADFKRIFRIAKPDERVLVIGGGFTGSEIAAALAHEGMTVAMLFPEPYICSRVFPLSLGVEMNRKFRAQGINLVEDDRPLSIVPNGDVFVTTTRNGAIIESDHVVAGIGITPTVALAEQGSLLVNDGIQVNERLQTSHPDIFAAGDNANLFYEALGERFRFEHWDAAITEGGFAGRNMTGDLQPLTTLPYFYSDLFDFGYEAVGDTDPEQDTVSVWVEENETGVIAYQREDRVRGVMMCNVWDKVDAARRLIGAKEPVSEETLRAVFGLP